MEYFINNRVWREIHPFNNSKKEISFEEFCSDKNIIVHDAGDNWKERGFASKNWTVFKTDSIQHYKKRGLKIN